MKNKNLLEHKLKKIITQVILETNDEEESDKLEHKKKQFLTIENFEFVESKPLKVDNSNIQLDTDFYVKKFPYGIVVMRVVEFPEKIKKQTGFNYLIQFDVKPNGLEYIKYGEEEEIGSKGWIRVKYLTDSEVEKYMKNAANYLKFKYDMDNAPRIRY